MQSCVRQKRKSNGIERSEGTEKKVHVMFLYLPLIEMNTYLKIIYL